MDEGFLVSLLAIVCNSSVDELPDVARRNRLRVVWRKGKDDSDERETVPTMWLTGRVVTMEYAALVRTTATGDNAMAIANRCLCCPHASDSDVDIVTERIQRMAAFSKTTRNAISKLLF